MTYDYRGIGDSRHHSLRKLKADWIDWGQHDFEGVLRYVARRFPGQPIDVVGHSASGFVIGLAQSAITCAVSSLWAHSMPTGGTTHPRLGALCSCVGI